MERAVDTGSYILEEIEIEDDSDSDQEYVVVDVDSKKEIIVDEDIVDVAGGDQPTVFQSNEVVDDYVRNFLKRMSMPDTLSAFQKEWYSTPNRPLFRDLSEEIENKKKQILQMEADKKKWQTVSDEVQQTWDRLKQERKYHREGLSAVEKEKNQLLNDLKKMKKTKKRLDPALVELQLKFEQVNKERSLLRIERDRLLEEIQKLQKSGEGQSPTE